jgi:hypothetical protein
LACTKVQVLASRSMILAGLPLLIVVVKIFYGVACTGQCQQGPQLRAAESSWEKVDDAGMWLQMVDLPDTIFQEASKAASMMEVSDTGLISVSKKGEEIPEGMVAEILTMLTTNTAHLSIPPPQVPPPNHTPSTWTRSLCS